MNKAAQDVLDKVVAAVRAKLGREDAAVRLSASGARSNVTEVIPTGISVIDHWLCGVGGLPIGRTSEWSGAEGIGKTAWALHCMAATQRAGGVTIYGDAEGSFSEERAFSFGVDPDKVVLVQGDTLEEYVPGMLSAMSALDAAQPALVVYDSIGGSTTEAEIDGDRSADAMGKKAGTFGKLIRGMNALALKSRAHVMLVNQVRMKVGTFFGDPTYTPGGDAIKYACSLRFRMTGGQWKDGEEQIGKHSAFRVYKSRFSPPGRTAEVRFSFADGFDEVWALLQHAKDVGAIEQEKDEKGQPVGPTMDQYAEALVALGGWEPSALVKMEEEIAR